MPDIKKYKEDFFKDSLEPRAIWLSPAQFRRFDKAIALWKKDNSQQNPPIEIIRDIARGLEKDMELISERALEVLKEAKLFTPSQEDRLRARNILVNDSALRRIIKTSSI